MKTLKKLFSVSAIVALLGTLAPMYAFGATYTAELEEAYNYAHKNGITTMSSIDNANMFGTLTRVAMAKMIANYATTVLWLEADTSAKCTFTDVTAALDAQYDNWVTNACQLGLMGQNITAFRPNDPVTRGEFGTTLSRALNRAAGTTIEEGTPYYENHLKYLNAKWIMNDISNPNMNEVRGYVMLMMMRADDSYEPATEGCTAEELLACVTADDYDACIAACSDTEEPEEPTDPEEVKAGTLNVTMTSANGGEMVNNVSALPIATYTLKAVDEDIDINWIVVKEVWYTTAITNYALFINGVRVSKLKSNSALDKESTINLTQAYTVKAWKSVDIELRASTTGAVSDGFAVEIVDVNSSAEKVKLPSTVKSNTFKNLASTATTTIAITATTTESIKVGSSNASLFEFRLANNDTTKQDVEFNSITFIANNKDAAEYFDNFELVAEGSVIATTKKMNGKYLTFKLDNPYGIEKGQTEEFTVKADVLWWADATTAPAFYVETVMDVEATVTTYNAPINLDNTAFNSTTPVPVTVDAWRITITRTNPNSTTFAKNTNNVYLGSFTINNNENSDLTLEKFTIEIADKDSNYTTQLSDYIKSENVKVRYGSTTAWLNQLNCTYTGTTHSYTCSSDTDVEISKKLNVYLYADIENSGATTWLDSEKFQVKLLPNTTTAPVDPDNILIKEGKTDAYVYDMSVPTSWTTMEWKASTLNVTRVSLSDKTYAYGTEEIDAVSFKIKTADNGVKVKTITFTQVQPTIPGNELTRNSIAAVRVFVDDEEYSATLNTNGTITMKTPFELDSNTTSVVTLQIDLWTNPAATILYNLTNVEATDTTSDKNDVSWAGTIAWRTITTSDGGTLSVTYENTDINNSTKSILWGTSWVVAEYGIKASYEDIRVKEIELTFAGLTATSVEDVELYLGDTMVASDPEWTGWKATFKDLSFDATTTKASLTVNVVSKLFDGDAAVKDAQIKDMQIKKASWKDSWNDRTGGITQDTQEFDIVPATVLASVTSSDSSETKLNLFVNKWDNKQADDSDYDVYVTDLMIGSITSNLNGLSSATIENNAWTTLVNYSIAYEQTSCGAGTKTWWKIWDNYFCVTITPVSTTISDYLLRNGNNEFTISYTPGTATNPAYTIKLNKDNGVIYTTSGAEWTAYNVAHTAISALDNTFENRQPSSLTLVNAK